MVFLLKNGASKKDIEAIETKFFKEKTLTGFNAKIQWCTFLEERCFIHSIKFKK